MSSVTEGNASLANHSKRSELKANQNTNKTRVADTKRGKMPATIGATKSVCRIFTSDCRVIFQPIKGDKN